MSDEDLMRRLRAYEEYGDYDLLMQSRPERLRNADGFAAADEIMRLRDLVDLRTQQLFDVCAVATEGFEIVAGKRQCVDNLMGHADVAEYALRLINALKGAGNVD